MGKCFIFKMLFLTRIKALLFTYNVCVNLVLKFFHCSKLMVLQPALSCGDTMGAILQYKLRSRILSSGTYQSHGELVKELSSQTLNTTSDIFFPSWLSSFLYWLNC